jgi:tRNA nucleotidyltransferase (CCA-adding enzyme)
MTKMIDRQVSHADIATFASDRVNLSRDDVVDYRAQVSRLRGKLTAYIDQHPGFDLVKMLHSGSVAKGTALKTLNDMDVAVYVRAGSAPQDEATLLSWTADRLREAYGGTIKPEQVTIGHHCVTLGFKGSGLDVDVVPVLYEGDPDDRGYLIPPSTGARVLTSIPLHLEFVRKRKNAQPHHFRQMVRLVKWWAGIQKQSRDDFRFKSFITELLLAKMVDQKVVMDDYADALFNFFSYIVRTRLSERVVFEDHYAAKDVVADGNPVQIYDPVNPANNVACLYTPANVTVIVDAAEDALDAIAYARRATSKGEAVSAWQDILGTGFKGA